MKKKVMKFIQALEDYGDMFFSQGSVKEDYEYIKSVLNAQGYYSGFEYRYYFNEDFDLTKIEKRF